MLNSFEVNIFAPINRYRFLLRNGLLLFIFSQQRHKFGICTVDNGSIDRRQINQSRFFGSMPHPVADDRYGYIVLACRTRPGMAGYIEYKNKTQEKCNYCTIYQCISGFYKKNVELHLLLILAIDSVIYSFYVTILLCKKAPVFD